jgi:hypothetical protein
LAIAATVTGATLSNILRCMKKPGAGEANRTPDPNLGKGWLTRYRRLLRYRRYREILDL